jgi:transglutaminase-like putative cysteine protease
MMSHSISSSIASLRRLGLYPMPHPMWRPMSRDKADTLLLLVSCALVLAPHAAHLPLWTSLLCASLLLWRGWITFRGNRMPPQWLLLPIAAVAMISVYFSYRAVFGRDADVAAVVLLLTLKLLEMRAKRDLFVVVLVSLFVMLTNFFYSQSMGMALLTIAALILMLTTQLSFQYVDTVPPLAQRLRLGAMIFGLSIPLTLVLFILFPRIQGPLWSLPGDANMGRTGLSDSMSPGNIADVAQSDDVAFRVKFIDPPPPQPKLYWRAVVLDNYDGRTWTHRPSAPRFYTANPLVTLRGTGIRHQVTLEPTGRRWLFALDLPGAAPQLPGIPTGFSADMQLLAMRPVTERLRYDATSFIDYDLQPAKPANLNAWLQLPPGFNPKTLAFSAGLRAQSSDNAQLINTVLRFFHGQKFSYTLEPPLLGKDAVDEFLFTTQAGFCEHYASAFVVLMRAMGIPARVVTGYQGGDINPVDGFMEVRQSDAHAWAEVWLDNRGWVRFDPTAAVAPERIQKNMTDVIPRTTLGGLINLNGGKGTWLGNLRLNWGAINNAWNQWVLNYSPEKQKSFIQSLGFNDVDWKTLISLMSVLGIAVMAVIGVPLVLNWQKTDPLQSLYISLCQQMSRRGYPRAAHEGPRAYQSRLAAAGTLLTPVQKNAAARFLALYESLRYGKPEPQLLKTRLSQLKNLVVECK